MEIILKHFTEFSLNSYPKIFYFSLKNDGFLLIKDFWDIEQLKYFKNNNIFKNHNGPTCNTNKILSNKTILSKRQLDLINTIESLCNSYIPINYHKRPTKLSEKFATLLERFSSKEKNDGLLVSSIQCITSFDDNESLNVEILLGSHKWKDLDSFRSSQDLSVTAKISSLDLAFISVNLLHRFERK
ncbi:hypothetical protein ACNQO6_12620 [Acinetobacter calcoaceticus]|uniref:hypothetical protein n=1 Tax=Acinetobacter calcoaceticus TaxID=471 RepID=UPI002B2BC086|nr:hypothetical protein SB581_14295 [Acinetobacter baumannii]